MITAIIDTGSIYCNAVSLSLQEIEDRKAQLRLDAQRFLDENEVDHIVYYHDDRDEANNILKCTFHYNMVGLDHETFLDRIKNVSGQVGEVHKSHLDKLDKQSSIQ